MALSWGCASHAEEAPSPAAAASVAAAADKTSLPKLIPSSCSRPEYPLASVRANESGTSVIRVDVTEKGEVTKATVGASSGYPRLDGALRYALTSCKFQPARNAAGFAVPGITQVRHVWRLEDAMPDPWLPLRTTTRQANWAATEDLSAVVFTSPSATTPDQRAKILRRLQDTASESANCPSIERVSPAPLPQEWNLPDAVKSATGRPVRIVGELWNTKQCDVDMTYRLVMRFPEGEPANFVMMPVSPKATTSRAAAPPSALYAPRVAAAVRVNIAYVGGNLNPVAEVELQVAADGLITRTRLTRRSGDPLWDKAVLEGIAKTGRLPRDNDGRVPPVVVLSLRPH